MHSSLADRPKTFEDWVGSRNLASIGTNFGSPVLPFQAWQPFKEAFAPEVVARAVQEHPTPLSEIFDPFGGSGTTALAGQFLGLMPTTIEVNPYLADVIRAKLTRYDPTKLRASATSFLRSARSLLDQEFAMTPGEFLPPSFVEPGLKGRWIFDSSLGPYLHRLGTLARTFDEETSRFLLVSIGGSLVELSNVRVNGKGRRYRAGWESIKRTRRSAFAAIARRLQEMLRDVESFGYRRESRHNVLVGDSRLLTADAKGLQLSVFSPPYPNSFDYTDVYNLELWMLGYLSSMEDNRKLRGSTLTSHVQVRREFASPPAGSPKLEKAFERLVAARPKLWSRHIPEMVGSYFADMDSLLRKILVRTQEGGRVWIVVGDSQYSSIVVPTASVLNELAVSQGWATVSFEPFRSMRTSSQQGGKDTLPETLIVLQR